MRPPDLPRATVTTTPELGLRAIEILMAQTDPCDAHARDIAALLALMRGPATLAPLPKIGRLPAPHRPLRLKTSVVSSRKRLTGAEMSFVSGARVSERGRGMDLRGHASSGAS